ncbi:GTP-binding protein rbg1 [Brettanomyces nanus]|uniref:GTP-binding protein rbg1 n=1 Tax=Eeniella nana TaxID=13502 RepID=A0A875S928_EENNA|nr:GTP-binding protein rbg1 [Brettanomyces nanus]QPG75584.1 GTP-binding protein rbg1 [Brettanomyces nanus]
MTTVQKIQDIEDEMSRTQKNKATEKHLGLLKARLAKFRADLLKEAQTSSGGGGEGFDVKKSGVASIGFVGFPSVGKSTLLTKLTGVRSEVAAYEFTTLTTVPGFIKYRGAKIQMLDLPGIIEGAKEGKGRGKQVIAVARSCDLIFILLDVNKPLRHKQILEKELEGFGIRLNQSPPDIVIKRKESGGVNITSTVPLTKIDTDEIKAVLQEYRLNSCDVAFRCDATVDDMLDAIEVQNRRYIPAIYLLNKIDSISVQELELLYRIPNAVPISAGKEWNLDELLEIMWDRMNLVRVYTKPKGKMPDFTDPVILKGVKCTVKDFCAKIHHSLIDEFKTAQVYGSSVKHQPQYVGLGHVLHDEDVITILKK